MIALQDTVRPQAAAAVRKLHDLGIKVAMLTGDREATARVIAGQSGVDLVFAGLCRKIRYRISRRFGSNTVM